MGWGLQGAREAAHARLWVRLSAAIIACTLTASAWAQQPSPELRRQFDELYERLLDDPSDVGLNQRYIEVALALGDYDAAIGALERLIFYDPQNPFLQLQTGRLYLQTESYAVARGYFEAVLALPTTTGEMRVEATNLIADIDRLTRPSPWSGIAQAGIRHQSNANVGPTFLGENEQFPVDPPQPDWNVFGLGALNYANQMGNVVLEASLSTYYADQFDIDRLDVGFAELIAGPRLITDDGALALKPYGLVQGILLGADPYQRAYGGGVLVRWTFAEGWWFEPRFEYKDRRFYNSDDYAAATDQTGDYYSYAINGGGQFRDDLSWQSRLVFSQNDAAAEYLSYDQYFASLAVRLVLPFPEDWLFTPFATVSQTDYKDIAPNERELLLDTIRQDFQWSAGATLEVPVLESLTLGVQVQYVDNKSNLDRYTYDNLQVSSGPIVRF